MPVITIQNLGDLSGGPRFSEAYGLNDKGEVVGYGTNASTNIAFLWTSRTKMKPLKLPSGATYTVATGINSSGLIVGHASFPGTGRTAVVWKNGVPQTIPFNGVILSSEATGVNDLGEVCGTFRNVLGRRIRDFAFTWDSRTAFIPARGVTPLPPDMSGSGIANAINRTGHLAGNALVGFGLNPAVPGPVAQHCPYLWNPVTGSCKEVVNLPAAAFPAGEARSINTNRVIVGVYDRRGFYWTPGNTPQTVGFVRFLNFEPRDINDKHQIVGEQQGRAVLLDSHQTSRPIDLGALPEIQEAGWTSLSTARAINENGQIAGTGTLSNGDVCGYLLSLG